MKAITDICYCNEHKQYLDLYLPECESFPVFVYFHGGGLEAGDKGRQGVLYEYLTDHGIAVVAPNYRTYPDARYPDFLTDSAKAVAWVFENIDKYGNATEIYVGGSSAGGYISQMLCFDESWLCAHGIKSSDVYGYVHDAGQPTCHFNVLRERGIDRRRVIIDGSAPLYHVDGKHSYPPMLIIVSDNDMENRYEQTLLLASTLKHFGHAESVSLKIMHGKHCAYVRSKDETGDSVFGKLVLEFICGTKNSVTRQD